MAGQWKADIAGLRFAQLKFVNDALSVAEPHIRTQVTPSEHKETTNERAAFLKAFV